MKAAALTLLVVGALLLGGCQSIGRPASDLPTITPTPDPYARVRQLAAEHYDEGRRLLERGEFDRAIAAFEKARTNDPDQDPRYEQAVAEAQAARDRATSGPASRPATGGDEVGSPIASPAAAPGGAESRDRGAIVAYANDFYDLDERWQIETDDLEAWLATVRGGEPEVIRQEWAAYRASFQDLATRLHDLPRPAEAEQAHTRYEAAVAAMLRELDRFGQALERLGPRISSSQAPSSEAARRERLEARRELRRLLRAYSVLPREVGLSVLDPDSAPAAAATVPMPSGPSAIPSRATAEPRPDRAELDITQVMPAVARVRTAAGMGSGFLVSPDGLVVTNHHVVASVRKVAKVTLLDHRRFWATVVMRNSDVDLALLRIGPGEFPSLPWGDAEALQPGDSVVAIGYAVDLPGEPTVTRGSLSARRSMNGTQYLQIDAPINPGNSGGPLLDASGGVVGINTFALSGTEGLNFAISATSARALVEAHVAAPPADPPLSQGRGSNPPAALSPRAPAGAPASARSSR